MKDGLSIAGVFSVVCEVVDLDGALFRNHRPSACRTKAVIAKPWFNLRNMNEFPFTGGKRDSKHS